MSGRVANINDQRLATVTVGRLNLDEQHTVSGQKTSFLTTADRKCGLRASISGGKVNNRTEYFSSKELIWPELSMMDAPNLNANNHGSPCKQTREERDKLLTPAHEYMINILAERLSLEPTAVWGFISDSSSEIFFKMIDARDGLLKGTINALSFVLPALETGQNWGVLEKSKHEKTGEKLIKNFKYTVERCLNNLKGAQMSNESIIHLTTVTEADLSKLASLEDMKAAAANVDMVHEMEEILMQWYKQIEQVDELIKLLLCRSKSLCIHNHKILLESDQLRKVVDTCGPLTELDHWKKMSIRFNSIISHIKSPECKAVVMVLYISKSKMMKMWQELDNRITDCVNEAKDNVKFLSTLEKVSQPLYNSDPVTIMKSVPNIINAIKMIYSFSLYYNTSEKISRLFISDCVCLYQKYQTCIQEQTAENRVKKPLKVSENLIFGKFESLCKQLKKITQILTVFKTFESLGKSNIEGIAVLARNFHTISMNIKRKQYDMLAPRGAEFEMDLAKFMVQTSNLEKNSDILCSPEGQKVVKMYNLTAAALMKFECVYHIAFMEEASRIDYVWNVTLLVRHPKTKKFYANFDPKIPEVIREAKCLLKMGLEVPKQALHLVSSESKLNTCHLRLQTILADYESTCASIPEECANLMDTQIKNVQDIYEIHIDTVLEDISKTVMIELPEACQVSSLQDLIEHNALLCKEQTKTLDYKCGRVKEAVKELDHVLSNRNSGQSSTRSSGERETKIPDEGKGREKAIKFEREFRKLYENFTARVLEALTKTTKLSLETMKRRMCDNNAFEKSHLVSLFKSEVQMVKPDVVMTPTLDEIQQTIKQLIGLVLNVSKGVSWQQEYSQDSTKNKGGKVNFHQIIVENKDIKKVVVILKLAMSSQKEPVTEELEQFNHFKALCNEDKNLKVKEFMDTKPSLLQIEAEIQHYDAIEQEIDDIKPIIAVGTTALSTEPLKVTLRLETKAWKKLLCKYLRDRYKKIMIDNNINFNKYLTHLSHPVVNLEDVRQTMSTLSKLRDAEIQTDMTLISIERSVQYELVRMQPMFKQNLLEGVSTFQNAVGTFLEQYDSEGPMANGIAPQEASCRLRNFQVRFEELWKNFNTYTSGEQLLGLPVTNYDCLEKKKKELDLLQKLYGLYDAVMSKIQGYYGILWTDVDIEKINSELLEFQNRCRKLPKGLKDWQAFQDLKKTIDDFSESCPLLEMMANKSMMMRHWGRITDLTGHKFEVESDTFTLQNIMEAPLLKYKDDIEDICISAVKEKDIDGQVVTSKRSVVQYSAFYKAEIQDWVSKLSTSSDVIEQWVIVQNLWIYLEAVFVGGDIAKDLPQEAKRFQNIDKSWITIMQRAQKVPNVVECCVCDPTLGELLPDLQKQLEFCQKSLAGYLEKKRLLFPRFFFVSDPALLEILGQASDSHTIQSHLLGVFDNVNEAEFHQREYDKILAVISQEGEKLPLDRPVIAQGAVELWLGELLIQQQASLHSVIKSSDLEINDEDFNLLNFLNDFQAQVGLLGIQMLWTRDAEEALQNAEYDKDIMPFTKKKFLNILSTLIKQTTYDLSKFDRVKYETLVTIHVHQSDIFNDLVKMRIRSISDFEWLKQSRFYFKEDLDQVIVSITNVDFIYQNEFLGCTDRLALGMSMGGAPAGPAGTGKTETTKDMGRCLGKYVVVFNCSDQMDFRGLGRIYKGLAQSGSWGCFDEFNRIDLPVLSVAAQQIYIVLKARKKHKSTFIFTDGDCVDLNPEFGLFITMNPGYAGRQELPENLKVQFRTVSMMVPDRQIIMRVKLASCGFNDNVILARKFFVLYKLCEEQLTKQVHYDFGLRNILSVLRTLGACKRARPDDTESSTVMRVLRDMNLSKLVDEDEPLFLSLINDLFPGIQLDGSTYVELQAAVAHQVELAGIVNHPPWNLKLVQLYEASRVRHGLMTLGPSGAGKTTVINILMRALSECGTPHREMRMNPKAITAPQMFGRLDAATNDWTDGIFSTLWRRTLKAKKGEFIWIVLDGPVDAIWIENLNSVLDDNKTLTLANGDRITMSPSCKLVFEVHNMDNASPATVSRGWAHKRNAQEAESIMGLYDKIYGDAYLFMRQNLKPKMELLECNYIIQSVNLLEGLIPTKDPDVLAGSKRLERLFVFCLMWSLGALLELEDRDKLEAYIRAHKSSIDVPQIQSGETMFEYMVNPNGTLIYSFKYRQCVFVNHVHMTNCMAPSVQAVLLIGEQGTAKTVMIKSYTKTYDPETDLFKSLNFSSATEPLMFQRTVESYIEKRIGSTYGPPGGRRMTVFVDDINMPVVNEWGDQITNEIVRQMMEVNGMYNLDKPGDFTNIVDVQILAAMIHPGGGRNDIPQRLKRQFTVFNCTLPSNTSIDKIFGVIGCGYFHTCRDFKPEISDMVKCLVSAGRILWQWTKVKMLPTPSKFHYIFNLRDLSRIWQGMLNIKSEECNDIPTLLALFKSECTRVIADRFICSEDREWFEKALTRVIQEHVDPDLVPDIHPEPYFVDFLRDAPEPTGEEDDDFCFDAPKIYELVPSFEFLSEKLIMYQYQHNETVRGSSLDLVFFTDAMTHLVKISRIIRTDNGNALLVGVGGSGKQSLTRLASYIAGYSIFQITLTKTYNINNFMEDLKVLYKTAGAEGHGITFIFTDNEIKDEAYLEYLNNILSSGEVSNLFAKDEIQEITQNLIAVMKKEFPRVPPTFDNLYDYFISRSKKNLHVVLCFSPVGQKFRSRAMKFPGLISGCTIDWFTPWPNEALVAVSNYFLSEFPMVCSDEVKASVVTTMGTYHDKVSDTCEIYFERFRRRTHVTPKSYLSFINGYKTLYTEKHNYINTLAERMDVGLDKLMEASKSVAQLSKELEVKEKELAVASVKADKVVAEVTVSAEAATIVKNEVQVVKDKAQKIVDEIGVEKAIAEKKLEAAKPALEDAKAALNTIKPADIATVRKLAKPPHLIMRVMDCCLLLFQKKVDRVTLDPERGCLKPSWSEALKLMSGAGFMISLQQFPKDQISEEMVELLKPYFEMEDYTMENALKVCGNVAGLLAWTRAMATFFGINKEVLPLKDLLDGAEMCKNKMQAASQLIDGLSGERVRWIEQSKEFKLQIKRLCGDVLQLTGFLSYCGPFNQNFRDMLLKDIWKAELRRHKIPFTEDLNLISALVDPPTISEWNLQGLPGDDLSVQNGIIVTKATRYPLLIDPQTQGKAWIKEKEKANSFQVTSLNHKFFRTHLEDCLSLGRPLLIEDVCEELDPALDNVLEKNFIKSGTSFKVKVGDKEVNVMDGFQLYITTKLPNPAYTPEVSAKTSIIDFTVNMKGLENQLLGRVILTEKYELEAERLKLIEDVTANKRKMQELEDNLLYKLSSTKGSLVDDDSMMSILTVTKQTAAEVSTKLSVAANAELKINEAQAEYRPVASRGSILYFLITEMSMVNVMYQTSLGQFLKVFDLSLARYGQEKSSKTQKRIANIIEHLTYEVFRYTVRGLYENHKFIFTLLLALKIDLQKKVIEHDKFQILIKGGAALDLKTCPPKPFSWILDMVWLNLVELSKLSQFTNIINQASLRSVNHTRESSIYVFLVICCHIWQVSQNGKPWKAWVNLDAPEEGVIPEYNSLDVFHKLLLIRLVPDAGRVAYTHGKESDPRTPLICFLSMGSDPTEQIEALAKKLELECRAISMGQGQEVHARKLIQTSMSQSSIKFTNDPPQGVRAGLERTFVGISQIQLEVSNLPMWKPMLYSVAFLHTAVQERRKFGPLGWNIPYEFNSADFTASVEFVERHLDDCGPKKDVSWVTVRYMLAEVWFSKKMFDPSFCFYTGYKIPVCKTVEEYLEYIQSLPTIDSPQALGLHPNADITYQTNTSAEVLDTITNIQPKESGGGSGATRESIVYNMAEDMLEKLPPNYMPHEVKAMLVKMGILNPMNIFLRQEVDRMQRIISVVRTSLTDLKLAIDGTIIMSENLRDALDNIFDARVPNLWRKISWESSTLGFWFTELLERNKQFYSWVFEGRPKTFWMTGFFNPQGFLTAMRQEVTRANKGWALDTVTLHNKVLKQAMEEITASPTEGVYVYGLYLDGAGWDRKNTHLIESSPKVLFTPLPVIHMFAINSTDPPDPKLYVCPIYKKPRRTDLNYITAVVLPTMEAPDHWILRGVALLCDIT
ncbi:Dynein heavy chain 8, axonemal [Collichthys lucidus]|uniref:Dynein heavy chain 8, axonemal n=1 Tax=Collichthys lucidus TaxID=240159 RepID=A0A4V6AQ80_COLLU|nr:Dynein heavy chain 8, axonemal [Collichthys lucidus]